MRARLRGLIGLMVLFNVPAIQAQVTPELEVQLYAGLTITGAVDTVYSIEYVTNLTEPASSDWRCVEFFQLPADPYLWVDRSTPARGQRLYRAVEFAAPTNMVFIPPGTFRAGSATNEVGREELEPAPTAVTMTRGFWIGKYEVTQAEYEAVMGVNPSRFKGDPNRPVEMVGWYLASRYCSYLTQREVTAGRIPTNCVYRLPTQAEGEYACRGWTSTRFSYGEDPGYTNLTDYAWYEANSEGTTHAVGQKLPNPWGLYDVHGNVLEWCQDWFWDHDGGTAVDPVGPESGYFKVLRGGSFNGEARNCRSAYRFTLMPDRYPLGFPETGFRVVLVPDGQ